MSEVKLALSKGKSGIPQLKKPEGPRQAVTSKLPESTAARRKVDGAPSEHLQQPQGHGGVTGIGAGAVAGGSVPAPNCPALRPHTSNPTPRSELSAGNGRPKSTSRSFGYKADDTLRSQSFLDKAFSDVVHSNKTSTAKSKASSRAGTEPEHCEQNRDPNAGAGGHTKRSPKQANRRSFETTFIKKKKDFQKLKSELSLKQHTVLELLATMKDVYMRMSGKCYLESELRVIDVGSWDAVELARLCKSHKGEGEASNKLSLGPQIVSQLSDQLTSALDKCLNLCRDAIDKRKSIIQKLTAGSPSYSKEIDKLLQEWENDEIHMEKAYGDTSSDAEKMINEVVEVVRSLNNGRLLEEEKNQILNSELNVLRNKPEVVKPSVGIEESQSHNFDELSKELEKARSAAAAQRERAAALESQVRAARARAHDLERQLSQLEARDLTTAATIKNIEAQAKQRDAAHEARARKLRSSVQSGAAAAGELSRQRDALEARVSELHAALAQRARNEHCEAAAAKAQSEAERSRSAAERARAEALERRATDAECRCGEIERQARALLDAREEMRVADAGASPSGNGSAREAELWTDLDRTRAALRVAEGDILACQTEKKDFIGTLVNIAESEKKISFREKITSELVVKEEQVQSLESQLRDANILAKTSEDKCSQYENQIKDLKMQLATARNESNIDVECPQSQQEMQEEILHLRVNVTELVSRNEELANTIVHNKMAIEQQNRVYDAQSKVLKVRDELITMLNNKEMEQIQHVDNCQVDLQSNRQAMEDVNKQILHKANELQELVSTLEHKEQQIFRLEKIVRALEEQQKRSHEQRARLEEKISLLFHELEEARSNKTVQQRKYVFF